MTLALQYIIDAISLGGLYALLALGLGLIFGVMGLVNFAHGELIMIGAYALLLSVGLAWPAMALVAVVAAVVAALILYWGAFARIRDAEPATLMIASFAVSFILQNLGVMIFGARAKTLDFLPSLSDHVMLGGLRVGLISVVEIVVTCVIAGTLSVFISSTAIGRQMRAVAERPMMARLIGVNTPLVVASTFAISGVLASAATILLVAQTGTVSPAMGSQLAVIGFVATVIGGIGSLIGCAVGGFVVGFLTIVLQLLLPVDMQPFREAFVFAAVIVILLVRPNGIVAIAWRKERI
jgi:branched-chain amino acid transport system permease protein